MLDSDTGKPPGAITGIKGTHGVALDHDGKYGYVSDGGANAVIIFDRATLATVASIPAGINPDGIAYEPVTKTVWAFNGRSSNVTVIDATQRKAVATIPLSGKPEFPVVDASGVVYANIETKNEIVRFNAATKRITATWSLTSCESPSGLAIDTSGHRLFAVCSGGKMAVVDSKTGKTVANPSIGAGPDATRYDAKHKLAFSSNGQDGTLTIINAGKPDYPVVQTVVTQKSARTLTLDEATVRLYLSAAVLGEPPPPTPTPGYLSKRALSLSW